MLTAIPIIGWSGRGPDVGMVLYHNSYHSTSGVNLARGTGIDLGPGWSMSYSAQLIIGGGDPPADVTVVYDDGSMDEYTWNSRANQYDPPAGVHSKLSKLGGGDWKLLHKDQSYHLFDSAGLLLSLHDGLGNAITLTRSGGDLTAVTDASGRQLLFTYDGELLDEIRDPNEGADEPSGHTLPSLRTWAFAYDGSDRVSTITDPEAFTNTFTYTSTDEFLEEVTDKDGDEYTYAYDHTHEQVIEIADPAALAGSFVQEFEWECPEGQDARTKYTDRRGKVWKYRFDNSTFDLKKTLNPLDEEQEFDFDGDYNLTTYTDEANEVWTFTYDGEGNLLNTFTPLMPSGGTPKVHREYDALNNLTLIEDGEGNAVEIAYDLSAPYETLPTRIILPADGEGNAASTIALEYYDATETGPDNDYDDEAAWNGLLKSVKQLDVRTDHDILLAYFDYDRWGQPRTYSEGESPVDVFIIGQSSDWDSGSRPVNGSLGGGKGADLFHSANNYEIGSTCWVWFDSPHGGTSGHPDLPCDPTEPEQHVGGWSIANGDYTGMGLVKELFANVGYDGESSSRTYTAAYDELGRVTDSAVQSDNEGDAATFTRTFDFNDVEWADDGEVERTGPDGQITTVTLDDAGRALTVVRGDISATYDYDARGLVERIDYGNGAYVIYGYDDDRRLESVQHYAADDDLLLGLAYDYDDRDLPIEVVESDEGGAFAAVTFAYDDRGRLIGEMRAVTAGNTPEYDLTYTYDQGGNRIEKYDAETGLLTQYSYDLDDLNVYGSDNNRLMLTDTWDMGEEELLYTTFYYYNAWGNVDRVVVEHADSPGDYRALRFVYDSSNRVQYMMGETWSGDTCETQDYTVTFVTEFRYDSPRARYLVRQIDPAGLGGGAPYDVLSETWSDYDGDETYGDFSVVDDDPPTVSLRSYEPGLATAVGGNLSTTDYYHGDLIGTCRLKTDNAGASLAAFTYTAFGERICNDGGGGAGPCDSGDFERFAYAGAWGYQQHDFPNEAGDPRPWPIGDAPIALQHVGWRTYDPTLGRFMQRDPIGIEGGLNVYHYVHGSPTHLVDPSGLRDHDTATIEIIIRDRKRVGETHEQAMKFFADANGGALVVGCAGWLAISAWAGGSSAALNGAVESGPYSLEAPRLLPSGRPWYPGMPPPGEGPIIPSIRPNLPPGPLPPWNPDDYIW